MSTSLATCPKCGSLLGPGAHYCGPRKTDHGYALLALGNRLADILERLTAAIEAKP